MIKADKIHKEKVIEILSECFETNKTVNRIVKQGSKRKERIRYLMDYSFEFCIATGQIYLTDDLTGVIISSNSDKKLSILEEAFLTVQFIWRVSGIDGIVKALKRERYISRFHPHEQEFIYVWFIGLKKTEQGKGAGSAMLQKVIDKSYQEQIPVYLETSTEKNLNFYKKNGFEVYHTSLEELFGFKLYFLKRLPDGKNGNAEVKDLNHL